MKKEFLPIVLISFGLLLFSLTSDMARMRRGGFMADESVYFTMAMSIARDGDLLYTKEDLVRIFDKFPVGPQGIFLKKGKEGKLFYAKSFAYPLFVSPFFAIFDYKGFFVFHSLLIFLVLSAGYLFIKSKGFLPSFIPITFVFGSICWIYFWWMTTELFLFSFVFLAIFLWIYKHSNPEIVPFRFLIQKTSDIISAILFGIVSFAKPPLIIFACFFSLYYFFKRKFLYSIFLFLIFILTAFSFFGINYILTGDPNYMGGERKSFYFHWPYEKEQYTFENMGYLMTSKNYWQRFHLTPEMFLSNIFYYFFGRYSGMAWYFFPAFLSLLIFIFKKGKEQWEYFVLSATLFIILVMITLSPDNYYGGGGALGNRYFMGIYPVFFFIGGRKKGMKSVITEWFFALFFLSSIFFNPLYASSYPGTHVKAFPFNLIPPEYTLVETYSTNTNPHAFRIPFGEGPLYYLYFMNDNFYNREGNGFWTVGKGTCEMMIEVTKECKGIEIKIFNNPSRELNKVLVKVNGKKEKLLLNSGERKTLHFYGRGFRFKKHFLFHIKIYSKNYYNPYFMEKDNLDNRNLGIFVEIMPF
ncbi:MAG: hypothetical protein ACUVUG_01630 [Candidatus Aminicenantia bacterium]